MALKQILLTFISMTLAISVLSITVSAKNREYGNTVQPMYEIARNPQSLLTFTSSKATCCSNTSGTNVSSITATQTLHKVKAAHERWLMAQIRQAP